jgi:DNA-binding response OmpR family regulator
MPISLGLCLYSIFTGQYSEPMIQTSQAAAKKGAGDLAKHATHKNILIAEDDIYYLNELTAALTKRGFDVTPAMDVKTAIRGFQEAKPDIAIIDLILPGGTGFEVVRTICGDQRPASIPVIVLTNVSNNDSVARATEMGATAYLVKAHHDIPTIVAKVEDGLLQWRNRVAKR